MEAKHTPLPWKVAAWTSHASRTVLVHELQSPTGKRIIAECETEEDAAFIVRACNSHDDLVAAVHLALTSEDGPAIRDALRAVLSKASK